MESCQQVTQNRNGVQAVFGLGAWEEGVWRKSGPIVAAAGILLTASGETALGEAGSGSGRVEGARLFLAPPVCRTPMWLGQGLSHSSLPGRLLVHRTRVCKPENECPFLRADTAPCQRGAGLVNSLTHRAQQPDHRKTCQRSPHRKTRPAPASACQVDGEGTRNRRRRVSRVKAALRRWWDSPAPLAAHVRAQRSLSWTGGQRKRGVGRAEKSPESERTRGPRGKQRRLSASELCGCPRAYNRPAEAATPQRCVRGAGGQPAQGRTPAHGSQRVELGRILPCDGPCKTR